MPIFIYYTYYKSKFQEVWKKIMKEKFFVEIAGVRLGIVSEEGKEYVESVANAVNERITKMLRSQKNCSLVEASIFCAMDFYSTGAGDSRKLKNLEAQIALYQANVNRLKKDNEELRAKLAELANEE